MFVIVSQEKTTKTNKNMNILRAFILVLAVAFYGCSKDDTPTTTPEEVKVLPKVSIGSVSSITKTGAIVDGSVTEGGNSPVVKRGFVTSLTENPVLKSGMIFQAGFGVGSFEIFVKGLEPGKNYFIKTFAATATDTVYSEQKQFMTLSVPEVETIAVTEITSISVKTGGNIITDFGNEVTERGICYSKTIQVPTVSDTKIIHTEKGVGSYEILVDKLTKNTEYYIRAYAINNQGIGYGEAIKFKTLE